MSWCPRCRYGSAVTVFKDVGQGPKCGQCGHVGPKLDSLPKVEPKTKQVVKKFEMESPHSEIKGIDYRTLG